MALTRQKKSEILTKLIENWQKAKSIIFSTYQGIPVKEFSLLRRTLRQHGAVLTVAKKTLVRLAARKLKYPEIPESILPGAVSITFNFEDEVSAAKAIHQFAKTHPQVALLAAFLEGKILNEKETKYLATIPEKKELFAQFVGSLKAPVSSFHGVLYALLRNFVFALSEIQKKVPAAPGASVPADTAPAAPVSA